MTDIWLTVIKMSIAGTAAALAVILIRAVFKRKLPKRFSYCLWGFVLFRLLVPFSFPWPFPALDRLTSDLRECGALAVQGLQGAFGGTSDWSARVLTDIQAAPAAAAGTGGTAAAGTGGTAAAGTGGTAALAAGEMSGRVDAANGVEWVLHADGSLLTVCGLIWVLGAILLLSYGMISYIRLMRRIRTATRFNREDLIDACRREVGLKLPFQTYVSERISSPFVCGIGRPKIVLPRFLIYDQADESQLRCILLHEMVHMKRFDFILKPLAFLALVIHWFNPAVWLCFRLANRDMEMSCDEKVVTLCKTDQKGNYASTLLSLSMKQSHLAASNPPAFGESGVKARVKNILNYKSPKKWASIAGILLVIVCGILLLSNPFAHTEFQDGKISALLIGAAEKPLGETTPADTFILMGFEPKTKDIKIAFLPRNTMISTENGPMELGRYSAGHSSEQVLEQVNKLLGTHVKRYVKGNTAALRQVVDAMGGIECNVPCDMDYQDPMSQPPLQISLKKGEQTLNGKQAEMLVRFRKGYPQGDLTRIDVEGQVLASMLTGGSSAKLFENAGEIYRMASENIQTNMDEKQLAQCFKAAKTIAFQKGNIKEIRLPITVSEEDGIPLVHLEEQKARQMVKDQF